MIFPKFKLSLVVLLFGFGMQGLYSQSYKFTTSGVSVLEKKEKGKWGEWSNLELVNLVVNLDTNKHRIVVYSRIIQVYDILTYVPVEENDTDIVYSFVCKNIDGEECTISIVTRKKQDNRKQMYINFGDRIILYNIFTA
ncbi:hypothetical protein [Flavobacterium sp. UMI-01]|uniref:hypothetical protein n=1 Tax=Flavobacterium sp. UMI-01 TaxID=1441053 RepID=UPI001C7DDFAB|nr:hypothetical protein [Flavobacterium sp. UMI-01]GIZ09910.1 hypothetical protein FUMI01_26360 [Flavobacterium sp. UMI-01]